MGLFGFWKAPEVPPGTTEVRPQAQDEHLLEELKELAHHLDEDRILLNGALKVLYPGRSSAELAGDLFALCFRPLGLASFYLALADWERDALHFPYYYEGGRLRPRPFRSLSKEPGLTGKTLELAQPLYLRTLEEGRNHGVVLSNAEKDSGLAPHSWYGVPLGAGPAWGARPFGVLSFQSFQPDAFTESRRCLMEALGEALAFALKADPLLPFAGMKR